MDKVLINMNGDKRIPEFTSYEEMAELWDHHDLGDYWDQTEPVEFEKSPMMKNQQIQGDLI